MRKRVIGIIGVLFLIGGLFVLLYPQYRQMRFKEEAKKKIEEFEKRTDIPEEPEGDNTENKRIYDRLYKDMQAYNQKLIEDGQEELRDPYAYENSDFNLTEYGIEDGIVGYLKIPKMDIELPLYLGANDENMKNGAAHLTKTSMPIGGKSTNIVIAAHRGYSYAAMFRDIEALKVGDEVYLTNLWETMTYKVIKTEVILPTDIYKIFIQKNKELVTLITCHPYRHNYQRYIVYCARVRE